MPYLKSKIPYLNLEKYDQMPTLHEAISDMKNFLIENRKRQKRVVKIIHGYGSSGKGGVLRPGLRRELREMQRLENIRAFIPGEDLHSRDTQYRNLYNDFPLIKSIPEFGRGNYGITIVILNR